MNKQRWMRVFDDNSHICRLRFNQSKEYLSTISYKYKVLRHEVQLY